MHRNDGGGPLPGVARVEHRRYAGMIGRMHCIQARLEIFRGQSDIGGDMDAVGHRRGQVLAARPAVAVDHQPRIGLAHDAGVDGGADLDRQGAGADVPGDMTLEVGGLEAERAESPRDSATRVITNQQMRRRTACVLDDQGVRVPWRQ